jgi:DNA-binding MarR family transcriptional regulator
VTAAEPVAPVDTDRLPPTQYLILEVLAARHRTGEQLWTFPQRLTPALRALEEAGLVGWKGGTAEKTVRAWLTDAGRAAALLDGYETPADKEVCLLRAERDVYYAQVQRLAGELLDRDGLVSADEEGQRIDGVTARDHQCPCGAWWVDSVRWGR